uniref:Uncharacterized protein n=1 Tax=Arundo donax TaxID=35708 RepID=A0A0A9G6X9_ARUDO
MRRRWRRRRMKVWGQRLGFAGRGS